MPPIVPAARDACRPAAGLATMPGDRANRGRDGRRTGTRARIGRERAGGPVPLRTDRNLQPIGRAARTRDRRRAAVAVAQVAHPRSANWANPSKGGDAKPGIFGAAGLKDRPVARRRTSTGPGSGYDRAGRIARAAAPGAARGGTRLSAVSLGAPHGGTRLSAVSLGGAPHGGDRSAAAPGAAARRRAANGPPVRRPPASCVPCSATAALRCWHSSASRGSRGWGSSSPAATVTGARHWRACCRSRRMPGSALSPGESAGRRPSATRYDGHGA